MAAAQGLLSGAALTDLSKHDSIVRRIFHSLADAANLPLAAHGMIIAVAGSAVPLGFFMTYLNRKLNFNLAATVVDNAIKIEASAKTELLNINPGDNMVSRDDNVTAAARQLLSRSKDDKPASFDDRYNEGKAHFVLGQYAEAAKIFEACLDERRGHPGSMLYLSAALVELRKYKQAIDLLESLVRKPEAPAEAWRMLGYAYLFVPESDPEHGDKIGRSIAASEGYLNLRPDDPGARLNLACALGQLGPGDESLESRVRSLLSDLIEETPELKARIRDLSMGDGDFHAWTHIAWFRELIA